MRNDSVQLKITGTGVTDKVTHLSSGEVEVIERDPNLVVNSILPLIQSLLKGDTTYKGIQYWAVGTGASSWDSSLPDPTLTEVKLTSELGRKAVTTSNIKYLTPESVESPTPTNIIEISCVFEANECNGSWREFALFGGNATATTNSGSMLNKKHHALLTKTTDMVVERKIRLTLSFA